MIKRMILAAATLLAIFGLTAMPASAATATTQASGKLFLYPEISLSGNPQIVDQPVATNCTPMDLTALPDGALSAENETNQNVQVFRQPTDVEVPCDATTLISVVPANTAVQAFAQPVFYYSAL